MSEHVSPAKIDAADTSEHARRVPLEVWRATLDMTSDLVFMVRPDVLRLVEVNAAACEAIGHPRVQMLGMELPEIVVPDARDELATAILDACNSPGSVVSCSTILRHADGRELPIEAQVRRLSEPDGKPVIIVGRDLTEKKRLDELMSGSASVDPLTGLPSRTLLESRLRAATSRAQAGDYRFSVFMIDIDRFKDINDSWGHLAGDAVLRVVAKRLVGCLRGSDVVVRFGGDEFVVFVDGQGADTEIARIADRMLNAVRQPINAQGHDMQVTVSIGIAQSHATTNSPVELLAAADRAMYSAKALGRDGRYIIHGTPSGV